MSEMKHTPGPWVIGLETTDDTAQIIGHDGGHIAYIERDPVAANANLIAAAPDLLLALKAFKYWADTYTSTRDALRCEEATALAEAAIAKAEGR